jgi:hypothetical protein
MRYWKSTVLVILITIAIIFLLLRPPTPIGKTTVNGFEVTFIQEYSLNATIKGVKFYNDGWRAHIAPVDLCLAWDKAANAKHISFDQKHRGCWYSYNEKNTLKKAYITSHMSNNHIIPANEQIRSKINSLNTGDQIQINGYLVESKGTYEGKNYYWDSSLSRTDTSDGACEVFYVTNIT